MHAEFAAGIEVDGPNGPDGAAWINTDENNGDGVTAFADFDHPTKSKSISSANTSPTVSVNCFWGYDTGLDKYSTSYVGYIFGNYEGVHYHVGNGTVTGPENEFRITIASMGNQ